MPKNEGLPIRITIMSVGGRGANVMERLTGLKIPNVRLVGVGAKGKTFDRLLLKEKIELQSTTFKQGQEVSEDSIRQKIVDRQSEISSIVEKTDILFLLGNVAGEESVIQCDEVAKLARKFNVLSFFVGAMPFVFEGKPKLKLAAKNIAMLRNQIDGVLTIDSDKLLSSNANAQDTLTKTDQMVASMIENIVDLVMKFGIVNVDFSDLKSTVEKAGEVFFNTISVPRTDIDTIGKRLFSETCLNQTVRQLQKALYVVYGGTDLLMEEISSIGQRIAEHTSEDARIIFGVVGEGRKNDDIKVVLIGA